MEKPRNSAETTGDSLERLLEVEARLEERLQECMAEAAGLVEEARVEAARRERRVEQELREERVEQLRQREAGLAEAVRAERDHASGRIRRLRAVPSGDVDALARKTIARVLRDAAP